MGVAGLLKALADVQRRTHISEYRGLRVALDGYIFLHRGKFMGAQALLSGKSTDAYLKPVLEIIKKLRAAGAEPILVFDGGRLPAKQGTEDARRMKREQVLLSPALLHSAREFGKAVDVTPEMAALCVREMRHLQVECIVAPYEADAQLAHLALTQRADVCITEDVDLLAFGCPRVLFGLDSSGHGREVRLCDICKSRSLAPYRFTPESLPDLCVLSGCDYLQSIPGVGLKKASKLLHRSGGNVKRALRLAKLEGLAMPVDYEQRCLEARLVYSSQTIFHMTERCTQPLRPLPADVQLAADVLGPMLPTHTACAIAEGKIDPITFEEYTVNMNEGSLCSADLQGSATPAENDIQRSPLTDAPLRSPLSVVAPSQMNSASGDLRSSLSSASHGVCGADRLAADAGTQIDASPEEECTRMHGPTIAASSQSTARGDGCENEVLRSQEERVLAYTTTSASQPVWATAAVSQQFRPPRSINPAPIASRSAQISAAQGCGAAVAVHQHDKDTQHSLHEDDVRCVALRRFRPPRQAQATQSQDSPTTQGVAAAGTGGPTANIWADFNRAQCSTAALEGTPAVKRRRIGCRIAA